MMIQEEKQQYLDEALIAYGQSDVYPFHMPGHKRQKMGDFLPEEIDITEIDGFDNLHDAKGLLMEGQRRLATLCGADESVYLVGGSTAGILAAICGCIQKGDRILIGRNAHKSVYHAVYLMEASPEYVYPDETPFGIQGSISPEAIAKKLADCPNIRAVVLTSPTYDGVVSDIASIAEIVHGYGIPLIVDGAHGAHFGFSDGFPKKAIALGADLCVESVHKTLPAYTQSAVLHMKRTKRPSLDTPSEEYSGGHAVSLADAPNSENGYRFDRERVKRYLRIFQTSSPSYILMAGIDRCVRMLEADRKMYETESADAQAASMLGRYERRLKHFYERCRSLKAVEVVPGFGVSNDAGVFGIYAKDPSKILIDAGKAGLSGRQLYDVLLNNYHLQMEMASGRYVTALTTMMDTDEGFDRLLCALFELDQRAKKGIQEKTAFCVETEQLYAPRRKRMEPCRAMDANVKLLPLEEAAGHIAADFITLYPPGIPILVPGEEVDDQAVLVLQQCIQQGMQPVGMNGDARQVAVLSP